MDKTIEVHPDNDLMQSVVSEELKDENRSFWRKFFPALLFAVVVACFMTGIIMYLVNGEVSFRDFLLPFTLWFELEPDDVLASISTIGWVPEPMLASGRRRFMHQCPVECSIATGIDPTVDRKDDARYPLGVGQIEDRICDILRCTVASERLHAVKPFELLLGKFAIEGSRNYSRSDRVNADVFACQFDGQILR